ncbi:MAG: hypothetical protein Q4A79_01800 [Candidatus Saccharibacteria bacterium]|nr:hypothetical protein [Candidatus Saccharibacteria bacterium]
MKRVIKALVIVFCFSLCLFSANEALATETDENSQTSATSISISPVSKILQIEANSVYEDSFKVVNNGSEDMPFEVYASPYSYSPSEDGEYRVGFSTENRYTQISRWVTFKDSAGNYVSNPRFVAAPGESIVIQYKISTPASIPDGGQYAVLFAHTLSSTSTTGGIRTEASPGLIVYGRASGETVKSGEISDMKINRSLEVAEGDNQNLINASAKIKNTGNVDFVGVGKLRVKGIFGQIYYETPENNGRVSVIPEAELSVSDVWEETKYFGIFRVSWEVSAADKSEIIEKTIFLLPAPVIVAIILFLTVMAIWIIIMFKKRSKRRSRLVI